MAHVATVNTRAAVGSVLSEHTEAKRLGQLFDEWHAAQEEFARLNDDFTTTASEHAGFTSLRSEGRRRRGARAEASPGLGQASPVGGGRQKDFTMVLKTRGPRKARGPSRNGSPAKRPQDRSVRRKGKEESDEALSDTESSSGADKSRIEKRKVERLWSVMTNPKVRCQSFAEKAAPHYLDRQAPTHIEGFPPLLLSKLYQGAWRIDA